jgi:L-lactate utilization protein LutB
MSINERISRIIRAEINSHSIDLSTNEFKINSISGDDIQEARSEIVQSISRVKQYRKEIQLQYERVISECSRWMTVTEENIKDRGILKQELYKQSFYKEAVDLKIKIKEVDDTLDSLHRDLTQYNDLLI